MNRPRRKSKPSTNPPSTTLRLSIAELRLEELLTMKAENIDVYSLNQLDERDESGGLLILDDETNRMEKIRPMLFMNGRMEMFSRSRSGKWAKLEIWP